ncbi:MAG: lipopolysaccharide biosynthesis protein [Nitrospirae bacterium]|nr:lipopolysaccharide biosynthesis protein [Nitrospirota bacterium]MCL5237676.1 lipopolysaccharide biosynthesis protein [Nitrospirota bacterium]
MSFAKKALKSGLWLAAFRLISQTLSWVVTVTIARILAPEDYGLMAMAGIFTGYAALFSELGLGSAIIQKKEITQGELSNAFWFSFMTGGLFAAICFLLAYPAAWIFKEPRIIPITQLTSVAFVFSGLSIVPYSILNREARFKEIGTIELLALITANLSMLGMARAHFGVWTLVWGTLILKLIMAVLICISSKWRPGFYFRFKEAGPLLKFGLTIAGSRSLFFVFQNADKFIIGKLFNAQMLGYYSFAMQMASIPNDKILSIFQQVFFPVLSRYQEDKPKSRELYLKVTKHIAIITFPLFFGGAFFGKEIILALLGEKWAPAIFIFRILCIAQFFLSLNVFNNIIHNAQGKPKWTLSFNLVNAILVSLSIFIAAMSGFRALAIPWISVYPAICITWTWITLKEQGIDMRRYLKAFCTPLMATVFMITGIEAVQVFIMQFTIRNFKMLLLQEIAVGGILYLTYLFIFEKKSLNEIWDLRKA